MLCKNSSDPGMAVDRRKETNWLLIEELHIGKNSSVILELTTCNMAFVLFRYTMVVLALLLLVLRLGYSLLSSYLCVCVFRLMCLPLNFVVPHYHHTILWRSILLGQHGACQRIGGATYTCGAITIAFTD